MPREPIIGSGFRGAGFEQKGFQERNLALLLNTLSQKETAKSIEALSKVERDEWKAIAEAATQLNSFVSLGGTSALVTTLTSSVEKTIQLQIESLLSPLTNEINQAISDIITPFITDLLTPLINSLNDFLAENKVGAGVGGLIGGVAGLFIPGGPIVGAIVGAVVGGVIEAIFTADITGAPDLNFSDLKDTYQNWLQQNPGGTFAEFYAWLASGGAGTSTTLIPGGGQIGPQEGF